MLLTEKNKQEIGHFSEAKVQRSVIALMEFESYLKIKRDVRYQSVWRESREKESLRAQVFEVLYKVSW